MELQETDLKFPRRKNSRILSVLNTTQFRSNYDQRIEIIRQKDLIDAKYGYKNITDSRTRAAWLVNVKQVRIH